MSMNEQKKEFSIMRKISGLQEGFDSINKEFKAFLSETQLDKGIQERLEKIHERMARMRETLFDITQYFDNIIQQKKPKKSFASMSIIETLNIPDNLRKSIMAIIRFGKASAEKVASRTKRSLKTEEEYLQMLVQMGYLNVEEQDGVPIYTFSLGKRKSRISDEIWKSLIKDRTEMISFVCSTEIEKSELKKMDLDEMKKMVAGLDEDLDHIKSYLDEYINSLKELQKKYIF
ncbi:MAG: hypothetical protein ACXQS8_02120 [Candidatus Helarchaeales archaeon]